MLQIRSVEFAKKYNVPLHVRSSFSEKSGTLVIGKWDLLQRDKPFFAWIQALSELIRQLLAEGGAGQVRLVTGHYFQDWLLHDTDWNWRISSSDGGPSRALADIGSHFCDMAEHVTGMRITSLCADWQTFHKTRKKPKGPIETFAGKTLKPEDYVEVPIDTEDFGAVMFRIEDLN